MSLILSGTDGLSDVDGSAATPAIRGTDTNTGIFFPAADTIAFSEGGVESMRIDASGNVGIGRSPNYQLDVYRSGTTNTTIASANDSVVNILQVSGNTAGVIGTITSHPLVFTAGNTERMRIDTSGNVGIGVTPTTTLDVKAALGRIKLTSSTGTNSALVLFNNTGGNAYVGLDSSVGSLTAAYALNLYHEGAYPITFSTNSAERARIDSNGNLMVGTTSGVGSAGKVQSLQTAQSVAGLSVDATNASFDYKVVYLNTTRAASSAFDFIQCTTGGYGTGQFRVRGDGVILAQNTTVQSISDARVKENVRDAGEGLQTVLGLRPVRFDFKEGFGNNRKNQLGFIAQEVEEVFPDAVDVAGELDENGDPYKSVGPSAMIPVLVKAIQELKALVDTQASTITQLQADVAALQAPQGTP